MRDENSEVHIRTADGTAVPSLTEPLLDNLMAEPADPDVPFITVSRGEHDFLQTRRLPDGVYELECRTATDEHLQLYTPDAVLVRNIMWAWLDENDWWRNGVAWSTVDPAIAEVRAVQRELTELLDGLTVMDDIGASMDAALGRADELLAGADELLADPEPPPDPAE